MCVVIYSDFMAYSGRYKVKNPTKYRGDPTNVFYRSMWEKHCMQYFDTSLDVESWSSEELIIPYLYEADKKYHRYFPDFKVTWKSGVTSLIEVKPNKETKPPTGNRRTKRYITEGYTYIKNQNKWDAANKYAKDNGWKFEIWTEIELRLMGILPKTPYKPLPWPKKLKTFTRKKTK
jgi:hypothetical protein